MRAFMFALGTGPAHRTGATRDSPGVEGMSLYGSSISPDGRYLLYTKMVSSGSDLMLVENFK